MWRRFICGTCIAAILSVGAAQAATFTDSFDAAHDYLAEGVEGTGWDGFIGRGPNETVAALNASGDRPGQLYIASANGWYQEPWSPLGPLLYKMIEGDFIATVRVSDYAGTSAAPLYHNNCGLIARAVPEDAGPGEDWVAIDYFPIWSCGNFVRSANDDVRSEDGHNGRAWNLYPWLQLERKGNNFHFRTSSDGVTWTEMGVSPLVREDLASVPLQVGLYQATYSADMGYAGFDDFTVEGPYVIPPNKAYNPKPGAGVTDVLRGTGTMLSWTGATTATAHDVYFGTDAGAIPLVSPAQDANTHDVGLLDFGKTYHWRVDEVRADGTVDQGIVWSFTIETYGSPIMNVTATASSASNKDTGPEKTIDGSGLTADDLHSSNSKTMWLSKRGGPQPTWIQYEFDQPYKLHEMWVWNSNQLVEPDLGVGAKDVTIEYSSDAANWTPLGDFEFTQAPGEDDYASDIAIDFGGAVAKYVKLTINSNWGDILIQYGLSEVRFFYVPVLAREPKPASGETGVNPQVTLSWRAGREAASHSVYLDTDEQAVAGGTATAVVVAEPRYEAALNLAQQYFWKVVEVNEVQTPPAWPGEVWSLTTADYIVVDDFESYTNNSPDRVFQTWIDGLGFSPDNFFPNGGDGNGSGSLVGYDPTLGDIMETAIVHGGRQSMPLYYDNSGGTGVSETQRTFDPPLDWTKHGVTTLVIHFCGDTENVAAPVYAKINGTKVLFNNGVASTAGPVWKQWNIPLSSMAGVNLKSVKSLTIGVGDGATGGTGTLFVDDILLYATAPAQPPTPTDPGTSGLTLLYAMEGNVQDSSGKGNHGTASGSPGYMPSMPGYGQAIQFDGLGDYVDVPIGSLLSTLTNSTFAVWVNSPDGGVWGRVFDFGTDATNYMFLTANAGAGNARFAMRTPSVDEQLVTGSRALGAGWHHLAVVIDATVETQNLASLRLYQDGSLVSSGATTLLPKDLGVTTQNWLGRSQYTADPFYGGLIDELRIYNRALSESQVRYLAGER
ncbi:MAG: discoidin domain-containing protein [Sedimentisphaerales bacterium]|nr:discoidin domain-containing protein [Sedimentisphaerales bacterium]